MSDPVKPPLEQALDLLVYGPLGLALFARDTLPGFVKMFVARGRVEATTRRRHVGDQINQARSVGRFAVSYGSPELRRRIEDGLQSVRARAEETFTGFVVARDTPPHPNPAPPAARPAEPRRVPASGNGHTTAPPTQTGPRVSSLAIPDYDELSASQVVEHLEGLSREELEAVRAYEAAHRGRRTILGKIEQLRA